MVIPSICNMLNLIYKRTRVCVCACSLCACTHTYVHVCMHKENNRHLIEQKRFHSLGACDKNVAVCTCMHACVDTKGQHVQMEETIQEI